VSEIFTKTVPDTFYLSQRLEAVRVGPLPLHHFSYITTRRRS